MTATIQMNAMQYETCFAAAVMVSIRDLFSRGVYVCVFASVIWLNSNLAVANSVLKGGGLMEMEINLCNNGQEGKNKKEKQQYQ